MNYTTTTINKNKALAWLSLFTEKAIDDGNIDVRPMVSDKGFLTIISVDKVDIFVHSDSVYVCYNGNTHRRYKL